MSFQSPLALRLGPGLTQRQKAAVVVHLLISGGVDPGLQDLPPAQQRQLVRDMASLRFVDRETLKTVVAEFAGELDCIGLHIPSDPARILDLLGEKLSLDVVETLAAELGQPAGTSKAIWTDLAAQEPEALVAIMADEADEVCAILLSKLPPARAAKLLQSLSPDRAEAVAAAFARTEDVTPAAVAQIGMALGKVTSARRAPAFETDGVRRVGNILNAATSSVRRGVLDQLDTTNPDFAARVRAVVFNFENIPDRLSTRDLPKVLRGIDNSILVTALAGTPEAQAHVVDFMLGSISKRLADQIREEMAERDPPTPAEVEAATGAITAAIRQLEEDGEITLLTPEETPPP